MIYYALRRTVMALAIILLGILLLAIIFGVGFEALIKSLSQRFQDNPALIGVTVGGIAGTTVAIVEGMISIWRYISQKNENNIKRRIIEAMSYSPRGMDFDAIRRQVRDKVIVPDYIIQDLLFELVLMGVVRIERDGGRAIMYSLRD